MDSIRPETLDIRGRQETLYKHLWNTVFPNRPIIKDVRQIVIYYLDQINDGCYIGANGLQSVEMINKQHISINTKDRRQWTPEPPLASIFNGYSPAYNTLSYNLNLIKKVRSKDFFLTKFSKKVCTRADINNNWEHNFDKSVIRNSLNQYGYSPRTPIKTEYILRTNYQLRQCWYQKTHRRHYETIHRQTGRISTMFFSNFILNKLVTEENKFKMSVYIDQKTFIYQPFLCIGICGMPLTDEQDFNLEYCYEMTDCCNQIVNELCENLILPDIFSSIVNNGLPLRSVGLKTHKNGYGVSPFNDRIGQPHLQNFYFGFQRGDTIIMEVYKNKMDFVCELSVNNNSRSKCITTLTKSRLNGRIVLPYISFESAMKDNNEIINTLKLDISFSISRV